MSEWVSDVNLLSLREIVFFISSETWTILGFDPITWKFALSTTAQIRHSSNQGLADVRETSTFNNLFTAMFLSIIYIQWGYFNDPANNISWCYRCFFFSFLLIPSHLVRHRWVNVSVSPLPPGGKTCAVTSVNSTRGRMAQWATMTSIKCCVTLTST